MIPTIDAFERSWTFEREATLKVLRALTDEGLEQTAGGDIRTLGRLAWHLVTTLPEMMQRTGLRLEGPADDAPVPATAREIADAYELASVSVLRQVQERWDDATLAVQDEMYGGEPWSRSATLTALIHHQIHHRAQMTVLMRLAGLRVPGIYGPAREDWASMGMQPPEI